MSGPQEVRTIEITRTCPICGEDNKLVVDADAYQRWLDGELIQRAFPGLDADQRELLMTGLHGECFDIMARMPL